MEKNRIEIELLLKEIEQLRWKIEDLRNVLIKKNEEILDLKIERKLLKEQIKYSGEDDDEDCCENVDWENKWEDLDNED